MKIKYQGNDYEVKLLDDGTLDTVFTIDGALHRMCCEQAFCHRVENPENSAGLLESLLIAAIDSGDHEPKSPRFSERESIGRCFVVESKYELDIWGQAMLRIILPTVVVVAILYAVYLLA